MWYEARDIKTNYSDIIQNKISRTCVTEACVFASIERNLDVTYTLELTVESAAVNVFCIVSQIHPYILTYNDFNANLSLCH